ADLAVSAALPACRASPSSRYHSPSGRGAAVRSPPRRRRDAPKSIHNKRGMDMDAAPTGQQFRGAAIVEDVGGAVAHFDAIVLGAGISGLVATSILLQQGCRRILVADQYGHVGGNHIDVAVGGYTFDVGSLIFQDDSPLLKHFPELLPHYVPI